MYITVCILNLLLIAELSVIYDEIIAENEKIQYAKTQIVGQTGCVLDVRA